MAKSQELKGSRKFSKKDYFHAKVTMVCAYDKYVELIKAKLSDEAAGIFRESCFGKLVYNAPYRRDFEIEAYKFVNIPYFESLLQYKFNDPSLLVEAITHGSFMLPSIPTCYQRLEFLGDAVLDFLITLHLFNQYPGLSPGVLTDMRSASVNNDCYALSAVKVGLQKHILHASSNLQKHYILKPPVEVLKALEGLN